MRAALIRLERNIQLTAKECAIRAGYESGSAHSRANELLDFRKYPEVTRAIEEGLVGHKEIWLVDKERHLANLTRIGNEARAKGMYGVAGKMEELKGRAQGFYIDRNITMTKELSEEDLDEKIRRMFPDRAEFEKINLALCDKIFGEMTDVTREEEAIKDKASEERLGQLEEYQEDRKAARNKNLKENKNKTDLKSF